MRLPVGRPVPRSLCIRRCRPGVYDHVLSGKGPFSACFGEESEQCDHPMGFNGLRVRFPAACGGKQGHKLAQGFIPMIGQEVNQSD